MATKHFFPKFDEFFKTADSYKGDRKDMKCFEMDAIQLTLMLKSLGFRLESMDYDPNKMEQIPAAQMSVQISCTNSGITSKMSFKPNKCTCPPKGANNNSFWQVQGTAPNVTQCVSKDTSFEETSSNLLPNVTKNMSMATRVLVSGLLEGYEKELAAGINGEQDISSVKCTVRVEEVIQRLNKSQPDLSKSPMTIENGNKSAISKFASPHNEPLKICDEVFSTPLSSINVTPLAQEQLDTLPQMNVPAVVIDEVFLPASCHKDFVTSSPNPKASSSPADTEEREITLINVLTEANQKINCALIMLKCNLTQTLSHPSTSLQTVTPQVVRQQLTSPIEYSPKRRHSVNALPGLANRLLPSKPIVTVGKGHALTATNALRRQSIGTPGSARLMPGPRDLPPKKGLIQPSAIRRGDTPRPIILKKVIVPPSLKKEAVKAKVSTFRSADVGAGSSTTKRVGISKASSTSNLHKAVSKK